MGNKNSCDEGTLTMAGQLYFPFIQYDSATHIWYSQQRGLTLLKFGQEKRTKANILFRVRLKILPENMYFTAILPWGKRGENQDRILTSI